MNEKEKMDALLIAKNELVFQNQEKEKRAAELAIANKELAFQNQEKENRASELIIADKELAFQIEEKKKRAAELIIANKELVFQIEEKKKRAAELIIADKELYFQNEEKEKRAAELGIANKELIFQNEEKEKRANELIIANKELAFQNQEKEKRAAELNIANKELAFQKEEKENRAAELVIINEQLVIAKEKFRLVIESAQTAMVLINNNDIITLVNKQTENFLGYDRNELLGKKFENLIPHRFHSQLHTDRKHCLKKLQMKYIGDGNNFFAVNKNGKEMHVEIVFNPIETVEGIIILITIIDLTERRKQEATLIKQIELEIKNKELEQFAYIASHDLQEPLRTVSNYMQVFEEDYLNQLDENARKYIHLVKNATTRMSIMIKSLLDFSRLGYNVKLTYVDCKEIINDVIADLENLIESTKTVIEVGEMPKLNVYKDELRQVFQNLISNSIKFHRKGITPKIQIRSEKVNNKWKFSVSDNGIGIEQVHFDRIFIIFQRLHSGENIYEGNGIGLANCKKIVLMHHGEIWLESNIGQGTTFNFTITNLTL